MGSYPKPKDVFQGSGRELLDKVGLNFYDLSAEVGGREFEKRLNNAAIVAIEDQNSAGIDFVTDGEMRRDHYVLYVLRKLGGFDFRDLRLKTIRDGAYVRELPAVVDRISYNGPILVDDYVFTERYSKGIAKVGLPGPSTVVDSLVDDYYGGDRKDLALDYAKAIRFEVESLIEAGCRVIQFDDPVLLRYPDQAEDWGLSALESCFKGFEDQSLFVVHICRGYPHKSLERSGVSYKANSDYYGDVLSWLSASKLDVVSIEGAQGNLDLSVLSAVGDKSLMLGVLDVGSNSVESVDSVVKMGRDALQYLPLEQLILAPDCGMLQLSRSASKRKLSNIASAASILNDSS